MDCTVEATERHEALRGLSATAELLVVNQSIKQSIFSDITKYNHSINK